MAMPRLPQAVAEITGAATKNPARFRGRSSPRVRSLGPPRKALNAAEKRLWKEFNEDLPWLGRSDRRLVELAVKLQHRIDTEPDCPVAVFAQMRMVLSAMGGTPVDRSRVATEDEDDEDPADEFLN